MRRIAKYGQMPCSCPYALTSSSVWTPVGSKWSGSSSPRFCNHYVWHECCCSHRTIAKNQPRRHRRQIVEQNASRTSWNEHSSTEPGSCSCRCFATALVMSRHRASTAFPFFSCRTDGWMHRFFRDDNPIPRKSPSSIPYTSRLWSDGSVLRGKVSRGGSAARPHRYCMRRFNSASAFSISGTVREQ